jgi:hypothetical protein
MRRIELYDSPYPVIQVRFPQEVRRRGEAVIYKDQTFVTMPPILSLPYGLEQEWGFRLQSSKQLAVFIPMRPGAGTTPPKIAFGGIFPCLTLPVELEVVNGYAIALIDLDEEIDLEDREGRITLFAERTGGAKWLREPSLIGMLAHAIVCVTAGVGIARRLGQ